MPINIWSEAYFSDLSFFNEPEISDSGPPGLMLSTSAGFQNRETRISRRARYPETTVAD
jgi:hypothetical protein